MQAQIEGFFNFAKIMKKGLGRIPVKGFPVRERPVGPFKTTNG
jgi:hypothetical protein